MYGGFFAHACFFCVQKITGRKPPDFLIIVGYLKHKDLYEAKNLFVKADRYSSVIMYALLDAIVIHECDKYGITRKYDRYKPIAGFIAYMRRLYYEEHAQGEHAQGV